MQINARSVTSLAGYEFDYIFDWTIIKFQQAQKSRSQPRLSVSNIFCLYSISNLNSLSTLVSVPRIFEFGILCFYVSYFLSNAVVTCRSEIR